MSNLLIITGAGASHDVVRITPNMELKYQPPLTVDLFSQPHIPSNNSPFSMECLEKHPFASQAANDFRSRHNKDRSQANLEEYLLELRNSINMASRKKFWGVPLYLYDLFFKISYNYLSARTLPSNYYSLIEKINGSKYTQIIWLNLNYDLLADFAIRCATRNNLDSLEDYLGLCVGKNLRIQYTKPHGSIDWFIQMPKGLSSSNIQQYGAPDNFEDLLPKDIIKGKVEVNSMSDDPIHNAINKNDDWYPAITAPIGDYKKFVYGKHIDSIKPELKNTDSLLCIGFSALDKDILNLIQENIKNINNLMIVNKDMTSAGKAYDQIDNHCNNLNIHKESAIFSGGFSDFIYNDIDRWIKS